MKRFINIFLVLNLFLVSIVSCTSSKNVLETEEPITIITNTPTKSPTATETIAPTLTSIPPTPTQKPTRTPIPEGSYFNFTAGFSFDYPSAWELKQETMTSVYFFDEFDQLGYLVISEFGEGISTEEEISEKIKELLGFDDEELAKYDVEISTEFAGERSFEQQTATEITLSLTQGRFVEKFMVFYLKEELRNYYVFITGDADLLDNKQRFIARVMDTFNLFAPKPYGFEDREALVQLTIIPDEDRLDPATMTGSADSMVGLLYSGLVQYSPQMQIIPDLAESWSISNQGKSYTFVMNQNSQFSSGDKITAKSVKESWERLCDPDLESSTADTYLGDIVGMGACLAGETDEISGVQILDKFTLKIDLDEPRPYFLAKLTYPTAMIVNAAAIKYETDLSWVFYPDSSGAYMVSEWSDDVVVLEANPNYHSLPAIQNLVFYAYMGGNSISLFEEGVIDMLPIGYDDKQRVSDPNDPLHNQWYSRTSMCTTMLAINPNIAPFDDANLRKAMVLAIDRQEWIDSVYEGQGTAAFSILPPAMPGYVDYSNLFADADLQSIWESSPYYGKNITVDLYVGSSIDVDSDSINSLASMWKEKLGINTRVIAVDFEDFNENIWAAEAGLVNYGWCADYPDPQNFLDILFGEGSEFNITGYSNDEINAILSEANSGQDPAERIENYRIVEEMLLSNVYAIPLIHGEANYLVDEKITNYPNVPIQIAIEKWLSY